MDVTKYFAKCMFQIPEDFPQYDLLRDCPESMKWKKHCDEYNTNYNLCNMYTGKINDYANYHCLKCNSDGHPELNLLFYIRDGESKPGIFVSWSLLISSTKLSNVPCKS